MLNFLRSTEIGTAQLVVVGIKRGERECQRARVLSARGPASALSSVLAAAHVLEAALELLIRNERENVGLRFPDCASAAAPS